MTAKAIAFRNVDNKKFFSRELEESKSRYVIYVGETEDGFLYTHPNEINIGVPNIERCVVTEIINHSFYDRDTDDRDSPVFPKHTDKGRKEEIKVTVRAKHITDFLERRFSQMGLINIEAAIDVDQDLIATTAALLLPLDTEDAHTIGLQQLRDLINTQLDSQKFPDKKFAQAFARSILTGIERAEIYGLSLLSNMKAEMEQRRVAGGFGISKLDERARRIIKLLNRNASEYEVDGQSLQQALANQLTNSSKGVIDPNVIASTIAAVLQQLGIVPAPATIPEPAKPVEVNTKSKK